MLTKAAREEAKAFSADARVRCITWNEADKINAIAMKALDDLDAQELEVARLTAENDRLIVIARADEWQARYWAEHDAVADREATIMAERAQSAAMRKTLETTVAAWSAEYVDFFGDVPPGAENVPAIVNARAVLQSRDPGKALLDAHAAELEREKANHEDTASVRDFWENEAKALRQRAEAAELFRTTFERPHGLRSGQCCDPVIDGEICALLLRVAAAEATVEAVKVEISGDANFGRIVELLFYGPLREKEEELRLAHGKIAELEGELAERALGGEGK